MDCYLDPFHQKVSDLTPRCASTQGFKALIIFQLSNMYLWRSQFYNWKHWGSLIQFWPSPYGVPTYLYGTLPGNMGSIPGHINCQQLNNPILTFSHSASLVKFKSALYVPEGPIKRFFFLFQFNPNILSMLKLWHKKLIICIINVKIRVGWVQVQTPIKPISTTLEWMYFCLDPWNALFQRTIYKYRRKKQIKR